MARIAIIGGGIAGCTTALRLAKDGHDILILEEKEGLLRGTSARTPGRMGLGYHYFDLSTAKTYMRQTVRFMKEHSECFLGSEESQPYLQNGRYFIVKDSLVDHQDLMAGSNAVLIYGDRSQGVSCSLALVTLNQNQLFGSEFYEIQIHYSVVN